MSMGCLPAATFEYCYSCMSRYGVVVCNLFCTMPLAFSYALKGIKVSCTHSTCFLQIRVHLISQSPVCNTKKVAIFSYTSQPDLTPASSPTSRVACYRVVSGYYTRTAKTQLATIMLRHVPWSRESFALRARRIVPSMLHFTDHTIQYDLSDVVLLYI
jgi:hypothetical protein